MRLMQTGMLPVSGMVLQKKGEIPPLGPAYLPTS
jgi:hypothetical protein